MSKLAVVPATAEAHARLINEAWQKTVPAIIETGQRIREARDGLARGEFESMVKTKLNFGRRTAFYLMAIAEHPVLSKVHHGALLPPAWRTLADLARLDEDKLEAAIEDGTVHPKMERKDVAALLPPPKRRDDADAGDAGDAGADDAGDAGDAAGAGDAGADARKSNDAAGVSADDDQTKQPPRAEVAKLVKAWVQAAPEVKRQFVSEARDDEDSGAEPDEAAAG